MTIEAFAQHLGASVRTVANWEAKPDIVLSPAMQETLDAALHRASEPVQQRFSALNDEGCERSPNRLPSVARAVSEAMQRLDTDNEIAIALEWLDRQQGYPEIAARQLVEVDLAAFDHGRMKEQARRRARISQHEVADALGIYYAAGLGEHSLYRARSEGDVALVSILSRSDWLDLSIELDTASDRLTLANSATDARPTIMEAAPAERVRHHLVEIVSSGRRVVDSPLYRLLSLDLESGRINGTVGLTTFMDYALTMDMLEGELLDTIAAGQPTTPGALPLRDQYLPDLAAVLDFPGRLCAGGTLALCAIARPASRSRQGEADYLLLIQERSGHVLNAAGRLAVIPKGFHQPLVNFQDDAQLRATLLREMEEELFGREDVDSTNSNQRHADPMHPTRLSAPMRWLLDDSQGERLRFECTGFGINLVSGNFEFANLIVIDDPDFWVQFGGQVQANWESSGVRQYSSMSRDLLGDLIRDQSWSNEGLFALLQGLRRLREIGGDRVDLPKIDRETPA
ncbi:hypothetical protein [Kribbella endophytica]